ncbi:N-6 DNA methylase [Bradyrhizobium sp. Pear77]|uniref:N-6 DNA methylase n=1 Tax=Bradyrhizobium altum TaxID=1571202 RepID=UPI002899495A|nr:N-6 DNA methylase [Bradyrhizobium altum]MCC8953129.1 N-6 DNA methylase [Bradyrhizobium altum]
MVKAPTLDARTFSAIDIWRSMGLRLDEAGPFIAAMMVWARLLPTGERKKGSKNETFGFFDEQEELTTRTWAAILARLRRERAAHGDDWAFEELEEIAAKAEPGTLESLRQTTRDFLATGNELNPSRVHDCARWLLAPSLDVDSDLTALIIDALGIKRSDSVYCGFDLSAPIALELARTHPVELEAPTASLARLTALLGIAGNYSLKVSCSDPARGQIQDPEQGLMWLEQRKRHGYAQRSFDHAIVLPPFGRKYSPDKISDDLSALPGTASMADALHINLALTRSHKHQLILLADGFLFRTTKSDQAYKRLIVSNYGLSVVIGLPRGIIGHNSGVASSLLVFDATNTSLEQTVRFVDCRTKAPSKLRMQNPLAKEHQTREWLARVKGKGDDEYVIEVNVDELADNDYNLAVDRYVVDPEIRRQRQLLNKQTTVPLSDLAELYRPQPFKPTPEHRRPPTGEIITVREVTTSDIQDGVVKRPEKGIDIWIGDVDQIERIILRGGDILISVKGKVGVAGVVPDYAPTEFFNGWTAGQSFVIARLRQSSPISDPLVLARYLASSFGQAQLQALAGGTTVPLIPMGDLKRLPIPVPPIERQRQIMNQIQMTQSLRQQIEQIQGQILQQEQDTSDLFFAPPRALAKPSTDRP